VSDADLKIPSKNERVVCKMLSAFVADMFGPELAKRCMTAEVRRSANTDEYELHIAFHYHGIVGLSLADRPTAAAMLAFKDDVAGMLQTMRNGIGGLVK